MDEKIIDKFSKLKIRADHYWKCEILGLGFEENKAQKLRVRASLNFTFDEAYHFLIIDSHFKWESTISLIRLAITHGDCLEANLLGNDDCVTALEELEKLSTLDLEADEFLQKSSTALLIIFERIRFIFCIDFLLQALNDLEIDAKKNGYKKTYFHHLPHAVKEKK